jgi:hypothetical protein
MKRLPQLLVILALLLSLVGAIPSAASALQSSNSNPPADGFFQLLGSSPTPRPGLFLPFLLSPRGSLSGRITGPTGQPLSGVTLVDQNGATTTTNSSGVYTFDGSKTNSLMVAPSMKGYVFSPAVINVDSAQHAGGMDFTALAAGTELIANGGFEANSAWEFPSTQYSASYSTAAAHAGSRSARTGIIDDKNIYSYSSIRQAISVPSDAASATLDLWLYPITGEPTTQTLMQKVSAADFVASADTSDAQYVLVLDKNNNLIETLLWMLSNNQKWSLYTFNLSKYAGQTIKIQVGTYNDGYGGITGMYADDISVVSSSSGGTTPTPTPTPTSSPSTCSNLIANSSFETGSSWNIPVTEYSAGYSTDVAHNGSRSMRSGILKSGQNKLSYSDVYQAVTISSNATNPTLGLWIYPVSSQTTTQSLPPSPSVNQLFSIASPATDVQYVLVLDAYGNVLDTLFWESSNAQAWSYHEFSFSKYKGMTVRIQFGTYNNGTDGITAMYVDDVTVTNCATISPTPTASPTATAAPTTTPNPALCAEKFSNTGFETDSAWTIPITTFSAGYSTDQRHAGTRSMRTGIPASAHNRFSYSDFRQSVTIPSGATSAQVTLWTYPTSGEPGALSHTNDVQYLLVLDANQNWIDTLVWQISNEQTWSTRTFDLSDYAGSTIMLQFGTYNDGFNGVTSMYVDDVSMQVCQ